MTYLFQRVNLLIILNRPFNTVWGVAEVGLIGRILTDPDRFEGKKRFKIEMIFYSN